MLAKAKNGDKSAMEKLVMMNGGLVWSMVSRFLGRGVEADDLYQIGSIGLIKAITRFDADMGTQFSTYAVPLIVGEIRRFLRDDGIIKVSRSVKELSQKAGYAARELGDLLGREPTLSELSEYMNIPREDIAASLEATAQPGSIYQTVGGDDSPQLLIDKIAPGSSGENGVVNRITVRELLHDAQPRERQIIYYRYFKDKTQCEIAKLLGISQVQVSRIEKRLLIKLRERLGGQTL